MLSTVYNNSEKSILENEDSNYCLLSIVLQRLKNEPEDIAFQYFDDHNKLIDVRIDDFVHDINSFAAYIKSKNMYRKHIAIVGDNSYLWIVSFFAIVISGNVAVLIDKNYDKHSVFNLCKQADVDSFFYTQDYKEKALFVHDNLSISADCINDIFNENIAKFNESILNQFSQNVNLPSVIVFTSGTAKVPKAVVLSQQNIVANVKLIDKMFTYKGKISLVLPLHHVFALNACLLTFFYKRQTIFIHKSIFHLRNEITNIYAKIILLVPALLPLYFDIYKDLKKINMHHKLPRIIVSAGSKTPAKAFENARSLDICLLTAYGQSEYSAAIAYMNKMPEHNEEILTPLMPESDIKIVNADKNGFGEICVRGKSIMLKYYKDEKSTNKVIRDSWLHTGDLGKIDHGFLKVLDRMDSTIILSNGENISASALQDKFREIDGAEELVVYFKDNNIILEIFPKKEFMSKDGKIEIKKKFNNINKKLPSYKRCSKLIFRDKPFIKNKLGKIILSKLGS